MLFGPDFGFVLILWRKRPTEEVWCLALMVKHNTIDQSVFFSSVTDVSIKNFLSRDNRLDGSISKESRLWPCKTDSMNSMLLQKLSTKKYRMLINRLLVISSVVRIIRTSNLWESESERERLLMLISYINVCSMWNRFVASEKVHVYVYIIYYLRNIYVAV